ncbi:hypothetical protein BDR07DRAFT_344963 [Suillus spraguei]|nr:hypothetical protein BDR07DRAFT_344963 [Suillus spraguei]
MKALTYKSELSTREGTQIGWRSSLRFGILRTQHNKCSCVCSQRKIPRLRWVHHNTDKRRSMSMMISCPFGRYRTWSDFGSCDGLLVLVLGLPVHLHAPSRVPQSDLVSNIW